MNAIQRYRMGLDLAELGSGETSFPPLIDVRPVQPGDVGALARLEIAGYAESADSTLRDLGFSAEEEQLILRENMAGILGV